MKNYIKIRVSFRRTFSQENNLKVPTSNLSSTLQATYVLWYVGIQSINGNKCTSLDATVGPNLDNWEGL